MKWIRTILIIIILTACCAVILFINLPRFNDFQTEGQLTLKGLQQPVTVTRDDSGMAYIHAQNLEDLLFAQGFVTAQDRLFQMQMTRLYFQGRLSELAGAKARDVDIRMRTIGIDRMAEKQAGILNSESRRLFQRYVEGINAFIDTTPSDLPLEFRLAGISPGPWEVKDALGVLLYMGYSTAANLGTEIISQMLAGHAGVRKNRSFAAAQHQHR